MGDEVWAVGEVREITHATPRWKTREARHHRLRQKIPHSPQRYGGRQLRLSETSKLKDSCYGSLPARAKSGVLRLADRYCS